MKLSIDLGTLAKVTGGRLMKGSPAARFDSFVTDTRKLKCGEFLWALKGAAYDAHDFLPAAVPCSAGFIAREKELAELKELPPAAVGVADTLKALQALAAWHRGRFNIPLTAITGSNGKSTTKEMLRSIFAQRGATCSNAGNLNNQFGLPLSLLELTAEHSYGVFELGASRRGDIKEIAGPAAPTCGVITNIGPSHLQHFGDMETIFETKTELAGCLAEGGTLVYNYDDKYLERLNCRDFKKITFGRDPQADIRILEGDKLRLEHDGELVAVDLPYAGGHNFYNAAAAAGAALAAGLDFAAIKKGLELYTPPPMRLQELRFGGATVILDAYNANPQSMASAIKETCARQKPLYFMLGDMKELGQYSAHYHTDLGAALAHTGAERVFFAGPEMKPAVEAYMQAGGKCAVYGETLDAWLDEARALIGSGNGTFLIKASRSMKFERIVEGLK
jgi:UDP-N-acetylmuramoyl-tripeptide--D-alanyl-D-alanine ligase